MRLIPSLCCYQKSTNCFTSKFWTAPRSAVYTKGSGRSLADTLKQTSASRTLRGSGWCTGSPRWHTCRRNWCWFGFIVYSGCPWHRTATQVIVRSVHLVTDGMTLSLWIARWAQPEPFFSCLGSTKEWWPLCCCEFDQVITRRARFAERTQTFAKIYSRYLCRRPLQ